MIFEQLWCFHGELRKEIVTLALTPALSPEERENSAQRVRKITRGIRTNKFGIHSERDSCPLSRGERVRVRAIVLQIAIK
jgi:hypothetical protein